MTIEDLREKARRRQSGITYVGMGRKFVRGRPTSRVCVQVGVRKKIARTALAEHDIVPHAVDGEVTDVMETGDFRFMSTALPAKLLRQSRYRPILGGVSFGHYAITAGTLGAVMLRSDQPVIVTNNHVGAACNQAEIGDHGLQPGPYDGGTENDYVSRLAWFEPMKFSDPLSGCVVARGVTTALNGLARLAGSSTRLVAYTKEVQVNLVDVSLHVPIVDYRHDVFALDVGDVRFLPVLDPRIDDILWKSGRTTKVTAGKVVAIEATMNVNMGDGRFAVFENQAITEPMCQGGDSGSIAFKKHPHPGAISGLLFAGSQNSTAFNPFSAVVLAAGLDYDVG